MPAKLDKQPQCRTLDQELTISVRALLLIFLMTAIFFALCFICKGPTYGVL